MPTFLSASVPVAPLADQAHDIAADRAGEARAARVDADRGAAVVDPVDAVEADGGDRPRRDRHRRSARVGDGVVAGVDAVEADADDRDRLAAPTFLSAIVPAGAAGDDADDIAAEHADERGTLPLIATVVVPS